MLAVDDAWLNFINDDCDDEEDKDLNNNNGNKESKNISENDIPKCSDIYISTQTKIAYLNQSVDLNKVFWKIPVINYQHVGEGVIKKQMKVNCLSHEDTTKLEKKLENFKIIGGGYDGEKIDIEKINFLATLPSMDQLRGKILGLISAPAQKIASIVKEPSGQLARLVSAHGENMDKSN
jgi:hypothetical protein